jgi:hypothetical protein
MTFIKHIVIYSTIILSTSIMEVVIQYGLMLITLLSIPELWKILASSITIGDNSCIMNMQMWLP